MIKGHVCWRGAGSDVLTAHAHLAERRGHWCHPLFLVSSAFVALGAGLLCLYAAPGKANNTCRHRHNTHVIPRESAQVCAGCVSLCLCLRHARTYDMHNAQAFLFWSNYPTPPPPPQPPPSLIHTHKLQQQ